MKKVTVQYFSFVLLCVLAATHPGSAQSESDSVQNTEAGLSDRVHYGDVIEVDVVGSFEFDWRGGLNPEGFLDQMEKVRAPIYALCRTESEIAGELQAEFEKTLREPKVIVRIIDRSGRAAAFVDGAVRMPHRFQIKRPVSLNEILVLTGGITDVANGEITIFRPQSLSCSSATDKPADGTFLAASTESGSKTRTIKISDLLRGDGESNPNILSGDIVTVIEALPIYVIGGVNAPKQLSSRAQITLTRAIAAAGGVAKGSDSDIVTIFRRSNGEPHVIEADLKKISSGQADDIPLQPFDIVDVPHKGRAKNKFPPVIDRAGAKRTTMTKLPLRIVD